MSETISEDNFQCGVCYELLVDPTTLTCGHSICRYCLAQWWMKSKKSTCPECRQVWQGFPKVNVTLRNTLSLLFPEEVKKRTELLLLNKDYERTIKRFDDNGKESHSKFPNHLNWSIIGIIVGLTVAVAVIIGVSIQKLYGMSQSDLMAKSLYDWTPDDVAMWITSLGPWVIEKGFHIRLKEAGVDGTLLLQLKDSDLQNLPIDMSMPLQRKVVLDSIQNLKEMLSHHPSGFWEYKEQKSGMTVFIMFGLREFPRSTLAYLYLLNYWDTFIPIFYSTLSTVENVSTTELMEKAHNPNLNNWLEFLPKYLFVPYYLVGKFASHFLEINYWTSRVVIMHAILMTLTEFTKVGYLLSVNVRKLPYMALKDFFYVCTLSICCKLIWPIVPYFLADCMFYWMLYVSPFDALNRLRRRFTQNPVNNDHTQRHHHHHRTPADNAGAVGEQRRWQFNFEWNNH